MSAQTLLDTAESLGIKLWLESGKVQYSGTPGVELDAFIPELRLHRDAVAALLARQWMAGDPDLVELLRLGISEDDAFAAVERHSIMHEPMVTR